MTLAACFSHQPMHTFGRGYHCAVCGVDLLVPDNMTLRNSQPTSPRQEEMLLIEQQDRNLQDMAEKATDLLASLDPDTLNPEQFNAWYALAERVGYSPAATGRFANAIAKARTQCENLTLTISLETQTALDDIDANIRAAHIAAKTTYLD